MSDKGVIIIAGAQLENGYTRIANEILESLAKQPLNGTQRRILDVVFRYTYGFNRKDHELSVNFLISVMGLRSTQYKQVCRELKNLIGANILIETGKPDKNSSRKISFNKDYNLWTNKTSGPIRPEDEKDQREWTKKTREPLDGLDHQEINNIKTTLKKDICPYSEIQDLFNKTCPSLSKVNKLTDGRKKKLAARWKDMPDLQQWESLFKLVEQTPFLTGQNDRGWKASFDWLIENDTNVMKVLEGKYGSKMSGPEQKPSRYRDMTDYQPGEE